jgi:cell shape-determining protein MreC
MDIENEINEIKDEIITINSKIDILTKKMDNIITILNIDIKKNTEKMGDHIDFIERIYDNVKHPLGYLCNKISYLSNTNKEIYLLDKSKTREK